MRNTKKIIKGQFFTKKQVWLKKQICDFIADSRCTIAFDPFAGNGDLLHCSELYGIYRTRGLDIDPNLGWELNDSLFHIPHIDGAVLITNPPYLTNYSASRKKVISHVQCYFEKSCYDDLYLIALDRMLEAQDYVVAIIPETFINATYHQKNRISSITILEEELFEDTGTPVCVVCFDGIEKDFSQIKIYKNETYLFSLAEMLALRPQADGSVSMRFNRLDGWLGLRAVDTTNPNNVIRFDFKENFAYDWNSRIKVSSRLLTVIDISVCEQDKAYFVEECNRILSELRANTYDIILSPFKGNMKNGVRRRRLDFRTARSILEQAYHSLYGGEKGKHEEQYRLF